MNILGVNVEGYETSNGHEPLQKKRNDPLTYAIWFKFKHVPISFKGFKLKSNI